MKIGVVYPQTEFGGDVGALRAYAETADGLGYDHILAYDHVVGADRSVHENWNGPYDVDTTFHEPFVMFGFLAVITKIELVTGIIILPQRQTALVAKQAAEVDLLTNGKFRLGVGIGWNAVEYEALGKSFHDRGRRLGEQIPLLRQLWTEHSVTLDGPDDSITGAGLAPLPIQQPIPIWIGGSSEPAYRRMGRLADGWFPQVRPGDDLERARDIVNTAAEEAGRDPMTIGMEGRVSFDPVDHDKFIRQVEAWRSSGATHVTVNTMGLGFTEPDIHMQAIRTTAHLLGVHTG